MIEIKPMTEDFIAWRCLHGGPFSKESIEKSPPKFHTDFKKLRAINIPLLEKLIKTYGTCAILAKDDDLVVGTLRFYPKILFSDGSISGFCLQQEPPHGPSESSMAKELPPLEDIQNKTLKVHCMMTGSSKQKENPYRRKGIGTRMARELIRWAREKGWESIEATAYEEVEIMYTSFGAAGRSFWEKLGFDLVKTEIEHELRGKFLETMQDQVVAMGLAAKDAQNKYTMRIDLT
jgi:hypothetical protein